MSTAVSVENRIHRVEVSDDAITAHLVDGRVISVPLAWSWRLSDATPAQRAKWELIGDGHGIHWPDIDEDLSAEGMLHGVPAHRPGSARASPIGPANHYQASAGQERRSSPSGRRQKAKRRKSRRDR
jgi:Protein of unknown function (DUF2442)